MADDMRFGMGLLLARSLVLSCSDIYSCITTMVSSEETDSFLTGGLITFTLTKFSQGTS